MYIAKRRTTQELNIITYILEMLKMLTSYSNTSHIVVNWTNEHDPHFRLYCMYRRCWYITIQYERSLRRTSSSRVVFYMQSTSKIQIHTRSYIHKMHITHFLRCILHTRLYVREWQTFR